MDSICEHVTYLVTYTCICSPVSTRYIRVQEAITLAHSPNMQTEHRHRTRKPRKHTHQRKSHSHAQSEDVAPHSDCKAAQLPTLPPALGLRLGRRCRGASAFAALSQAILLLRFPYTCTVGRNHGQHDARKSWSCCQTPCSIASNTAHRNDRALHYSLITS